MQHPAFPLVSARLKTRWPGSIRQAMFRAWTHKD